MLKATITARIAKIDTDRQLVFGWASLAVEKSGEVVVDSYDDIIDISDLEDAAYGFTLNFRELNAEHEGPSRGALIESMVFTKEKCELLGLPPGTVPEGWWCGFYVEDAEVWKKVKNGDFSMFSIEGWAHRVEV